MASPIDTENAIEEAATESKRGNLERQSDRLNSMIFLRKLHNFRKLKKSGRTTVWSSWWGLPHTSHDGADTQPPSLHHMVSLGGRVAGDWSKICKSRKMWIFYYWKLSVPFLPCMQWPCCLACLLNRPHGASWEPHFLSQSFNYDLPLQLTRRDRLWASSFWHFL